jgi:transcription elongation GreA/GreB family factor/uncharacterized protein YbjT (DUF2867 family)
VPAAKAEIMMSVAFRRESDEEHLEPKFELPLPPGPNYVTPRGRQRIAAEVARLEATLEAATDDEVRKTIARDLRYWHTRLVTAIDAPLPPEDSVAFGSRVRVRLGKRERVLEIVGHDEADPASGRIPFAAPLARALIGGAPGDDIDMSVGVLLGGGTGLVGAMVARDLATDPGVTLTSLVRTPRGPCDRQIDFDALVADPRGAAGPGPFDVGISCLGTTIRKAGSQPAFRRVDHDYVVALAAAARAGGARHFILVSSVGAGGNAFYLRTKGDTEAAVRALGFESLDLIRPGLLLGDRAERRPAERLAQAVMPLLNPLLRGPLEPYAALPARVVADAIVRLVRRQAPGTRVLHTAEIRAIATA